MKKMIKTAAAIKYVAILFGLIGIALLVFSGTVLSFDSIKPLIDSMMADGSAYFFTPIYYQRLLFNVRILGIALIVIGVIIHVTRHRTQRNIDFMRSTFWAQFEHLIEFLRPSQQGAIYSYALLGLIVLAILNRLLFISQPMRYDESYTFLNYASRPFYVGISYYSAPNNHLFHTLLVHIAYLLGGNNPWVIRLPAFVAGVLLVPATYMVANILYDKHSALLSAGVVASLSILIEYSTNARGYTLITLIFLLLLALGAYLIQNNSNWVAWSLFVILSTLGFYTIPVMVFPFGLVLTWMSVSVLIREKFSAYSIEFIKNIFKYGIYVVLLTAIVYTPVFVGYGIESVISNKFIEPLAWADFITAFPRSFLETWILWNRDLPVVISVLFAICGLASLLLHYRLTKYRVPIIYTAVFWCMVVLVAQRVLPPPRVWLFLLPIYIILLSSVLSWLWHQVLSRYKHDGQLLFVSLVTIISLLLTFNVIRSSSIYNSLETGNSKHAEEITLTLKDYIKEGDIVLSGLHSTYPLRYYFTQHEMPLNFLRFDSDIRPQRVMIVVNQLHGHTLESVIEGNQLSDPIRLESAKIIAEYESAILYEIDQIE